MVQIKHGWPFKSDFFVADSEGPDLPIVVAIGNFEYSGGFRFSTTQTKRYSANFPTEYVLSAGEILLVMTCQTAGGEILGIPARVPNDGRIYLHNQRLGRVVLKSNSVTPGFLYWLFLHPDFNNHLVNSASGTKILHTAPSRIESFPFKLPPLTEQHEITSLLGALDDRITLLRETNATLEAIAQALFKSWFVDFDPVRAKMEGRAPEGIHESTAALFPDALEESEFGLVPKGWSVGSLTQISKISSGNRPNSRSDTMTDADSVPLFGGAGIMGFTNETLFQERRILTGRVGTLGKVHIAYPPFWASDNVLVLSPEGDLNFLFCFHWLKSIDVHSLNRGSTQPLLTQKDLGKQQHVIPTATVLSAFAAIAEVIYESMRENASQAQTLATLRDTLLPRLISGQLRLPEAQATTEAALVGALQA